MLSRSYLCIFSSQPCAVVVVNLDLLMMKLRLRESGRLAQGYTKSKQPRWNSNPFCHFDCSGSEHKVSAASRPPSAIIPRATLGLGRPPGDEAALPDAHPFQPIPQGHLSPCSDTSQRAGPIPAPLGPNLQDGRGQDVIT